MKQKVTEYGLKDKVRVHLMDYRAMPSEWDGAFDRVVSVEMIEAVGKEYMEVSQHSVHRQVSELT